MMDDIGIGPAKSKFTRDDPIFDYKRIDKISETLSTALRNQDFGLAKSLTGMLRKPGMKPHKNFDMESLIGQIMRNYKGK